MALTSDDVRHVAKLARLNVSDDDVDRLTRQFSGIFPYLDMLSDVNTDDVEATAQVTGLANILQDDTISPSYDREKLLEASERDCSRGMIQVRKSI